MTDRVALILLAAGGSTRLGAAKQLVDVDGEPLIARAARSLISLDAGPVGIVVGARRDAIRGALAGVDATIVDNENWSAGLGTSIRAGVAWARSIDASAALITLCDQPDVGVSHLAALLAARDDAVIVATGYAGGRGVPAVFDASVFDRLLALPDDRGAKGVLADPSFTVRTVVCEDARVDLDTADDVATWRRSRG